MKKIICFLMICVLSIALCGCSLSAKNTKAKLTLSDGSTIEMSSKELCDSFESNEAKYNNVYANSDVSITGTVKSVEECGEIIYSGLGYGWIYRISLKEGWEIEVTKKCHPEVINLDKGDKITVKARLGNADFSKVKISGFVIDRDKYGDNAYSDDVVIEPLEK